MSEQRARIKVLSAGIFSLILVLGVARFSYTPLLPLMQQQAGLGVAAAGWLAAINYAGYLSGAIIASIVERAKGLAIKRAIATQEDQGVSESDLQLSFIAEFTENDIFPPTDMTEDWFKLIDYDPENVVKISPVRRDEQSKLPSHRGVI